MRVLVTGAAGFFGSRISAHFEGDEVHAIDVPAAPRVVDPAQGVQHPLAGKLVHG